MHEWDVSCETGDPVIDGQHREALGLINELEIAQIESADLETIYGLLDRAMGFLFSHFALEDDLMERVGYPSADREEMSVQHQGLTREVRSRVIDFRTGKEASVLPLLSFLSDELMQHEFGLDRKLADFIREKNASAARPIG